MDPGGPTELVGRIISGAQTGADRAALDVALELGIPTGGWVPSGRRDESGRIPERYPNLQESESRNPSRRTRLNVRDSDATLILSRGPLTGGSLQTMEFANELRRPVRHVDLAEAEMEEASCGVRIWLRALRPAVLNVAGPRASKDPEIYALTARLLSAVFTEPRSTSTEEGPCAE